MQNGKALRKHTIEVDLHGLTLTEAINTVQYTLECAPPTTWAIDVIHGYHNGTVLKQLAAIYEHTKICRKEYNHSNIGRTRFILW